MKRSSERRLDGKIPARIKYTFAFGALGKDMIYGMIATFSMIYFTDIIKVNPVFIGAMFFVAKLWDAFNDLFMGMIVDNTRSRWGKFIHWLVIGSICSIVYRFPPKWCCPLCICYCSIYYVGYDLHNYGYSLLVNYS